MSANKNPMNQNRTGLKVDALVASSESSLAEYFESTLTRKKVRLYAYINDKDDEFIDVECIDADWFDDVWSRFEKDKSGKVIKETEIFTNILKKNKYRPLIEYYYSLSDSDIESMTRVHLHYHTLTVTGPELAPVSLLAAHLSDEHKLLVSKVGLGRWYEIHIEVSGLAKETFTLENEGEALFSILGMHGTTDFDDVAAKISKLSVLTERFSSILLALYLPYPQKQSDELEDASGKTTRRHAKEKRKQEERLKKYGATSPSSGRSTDDEYLQGSRKKKKTEDGAPPLFPTNPMEFAPGSDQAFVGCFDIGAGHNIALFNRDGRISAYTDFGFPTRFCRRTYPGWVGGAGAAPGLGGAAPAPCVCSDPVMMVSHWDYDHYAMVRYVNQAYHLRWLMPFQQIGAAAARELYIRVLLNVGVGGSNANMTIWGNYAAGGAAVAIEHVFTPWGYIERGTNLANDNDNCLVHYIRVQDGAIPPLSTLPPPFSNAPNPAGVLGGAVGAVVLPAGPLLPIPGVPVALGLPAAPVDLAIASRNPGTPAIALNERFVLLPGDNGLVDVPSQVAVAHHEIVGLVAPHHGAHTWMPPAISGPLAAANVNNMQPSAQLMADAIPARPGALTAAQIDALCIPDAFVPANDPLAAAGAFSLGRIVYSYGVRNTNGTHPYGHAANSAVHAYMLKGWTSRLNCSANDWMPALPAGLSQFYRPGWAGGGAPVGPGGGLPHGRNGDVALGWQGDGGGAGGKTYLWRDIVAGGPGVLNAPILRQCANAACPRSAPGSYRFAY